MRGDRGSRKGEQMSKPHIYKQCNLIKEQQLIVYNKPRSCHLQTFNMLRIDVEYDEYYNMTWVATVKLYHDVLDTIMLLSAWNSVSQTLGHNPKMGREALASGSRKFLGKNELFCHLFYNPSKFILESVIRNISILYTHRTTTFDYGWSIISFVVVREKSICNSDLFKHEDKIRAFMKNLHIGKFVIVRNIGTYFSARQYSNYFIPGEFL